MKVWFHFFTIIHNFRKKEGSSFRFQETLKYLDIENDIFICHFGESTFENSLIKFLYV